jgi:RNase H-fold protein (predicted Holliday junction resolvase)
MKFSKIARVAAPLAFAALLGLAACSQERSPHQPENTMENESVDEVPQEAAPRPVETLNEAPPANVAVAAPVDHTTEDQQMQEDADASGMTSRLQTYNEGVPASESEKVQ